MEGLRIEDGRLVTDDSARLTTDAGLCGRCLYTRRVQGARDSVFWLCRRSESDTRFPKYPVIPVIQCEGYEPESEDQDESSRNFDT
ncbi:MAG: hypothetical protein ACE5FJ_09975 [Gemmatimonadales bacterium]